MCGCTGCACRARPAADATEAPAETEGPAPAAQTSGEELYFRLVTHGGDDPFWAVVKQGMEDAAALYGVKAEIDLAGSDLANQQKKFQEAVASQPDGIALVINDNDAWDKPVADAIAAGIPVIGINNDDTMGPAGNARQAYIGQSERRAGYMLGLKVFSEAQAAGVDFSTAKVGFAAEVPTAAYATVRLSGIQDAMDEFGITSEVDIIDGGGIEMTTNEQRETAYLLANPDTNFMFGAGGIVTDRLSTCTGQCRSRAGRGVRRRFRCSAWHRARSQGWLLDRLHRPAAISAGLPCRLYPVPAQQVRPDPEHRHRRLPDHQRQPRSDRRTFGHLPLEAQDTLEGRQFACPPPTSIGRAFMRSISLPKPKSQHINLGTSEHAPGFSGGIFSFLAPVTRTQIHRSQESGGYSQTHTRPGHRRVGRRHPDDRRRV